MIQGAIIGFGRVAENAHLPAWRLDPEVRIVAVAEESDERRALASRELPGARIYSSADALLRAERELDFIDIATPPHLHAAQAVLGLQRRCHVLCEKPLALNLKDFESLRAQARAQGRTVFCVHNWGHAPLLSKAQELVASGRVGLVSHVELHTLRAAPAGDAAGSSWRTDAARAGGGIVVDHGWHSFYLLRRLIAQAPRAVSARLTRGRFEGPEEEALCVIEFPSASAVVYLSWRAPMRANRGVIYGSEGTLDLKDDRLLLTRRDAPPETFEFSERLSKSSAHPDWFRTMLGDFKREMADPHHRYRNLREAELCLALVAHVYQSHRLGGRTVAIPLTSNESVPPTRSSPVGGLAA